MIECRNGKPGIFVRNTDGVTIRNNRITTAAEHPVHIECCENVTLVP